MLGMRASLTLLTAAFLLSSPLAYAEKYHSAPFSHPQDNANAAATFRDFTADKTQDLVLYALSLNGTRYKFGGNNIDTGFDCSGFVRYVYGQIAGLTLPRSARSISQAGAQVAKDEMQPGDLVFFSTLRRAFSHVGIYLGENRFIHASSSSSGDVMVSDLSEKYWSRRFNGARRYALAE